MTDAAWLASNDPAPMVEYLRFRGQDRKLRLLSCAACRRVWGRMTDNRSRRAVEDSERFADDALSYNALDLESGGAEKVFVDLIADGMQGSSPAVAAAYAASYASSPDFGPDLVIQVLEAAADASIEDPTSERSAQASLIREIFGYPRQRLPSVDPVWRSSTVLALARKMYETYDFTPMPILADALEDVGCESNEVLEHCRGQAPHVLGCWVVDLLLGMQ